MTKRLPPELHLRNLRPRLVEAHAIAVAHVHGLGNALESSYGYPLVDDPRCFWPDPECASRSDLLRWCDDVVRTDAGDSIEPPARSVTLYGDDGRFRGHIARTPWGLGVSWWVEDVACAKRLEEERSR